MISEIVKKIGDFETGTINLSDTVSFSQKETVNKIKTHQNRGFLKKLPEGMVDDRMYFDIVTPLVDTGVKNTDMDTKNVEPVALSRQYLPQAILLKPELNLYFRCVDEDARINDSVESFTDEGNIVVRKSKEGIYKKVLLQNLYVLDQTAFSLEDTEVLERDFMNQTELRKQAWDKAEVENLIKSYKGTKTPYYDIFYCYLELTRARLKALKGEESTDEKDKSEYVWSYVVFGRASDKVKDNTNDPKTSGEEGFILFTEELKPEKIRIARNYTITRYKPYEEAHFGPYKGRWLREGYREICIPFQNRANELGNQIRIGMKLSLKHVLWSTDDTIAGKNILSAIQDGQIIQAKDLYVLNLSENKNIAAYAQEWNKNIQLAERCCQAFEVSLNQDTPSSTTATQVNVQNINNKQYYQFKKQKLGIFFRNVYNRWVLPELISYLSVEHELEITGDPTYYDLFTDIMVDSWYVKNLPNIPPHSPEQADMLKQMKKEELLKHPKIYAKVLAEFYKDALIMLDVVVTDESSNKQTKVSNGIALLPYISNPVVMQDPDARQIIVEIANDLGYRIKNRPPQALPQQEMAGMTPSKAPATPAGMPAESATNSQTL